MRCRWHPPGPYLEKLGGFAPEWVVLLRNRAMLEACFGGKIAILGGFAPEFLSGLFTQILGGHAPVRAQCLGILASVTIVCYIIYTISPTTAAQFGSEYVYLTTIFVVGGILRYLQLTIVSNASANPTSVLLHDRAIQICILLWVLSFIFIIYCS